MNRLYSAGFTAVALLGLIVAAFVVALQPAEAQTVPPVVPIVLDPETGPPGTVVTATGVDWDAGDFIQVRWDDTDEILGDTLVNAEGGFELELIVPDDATDGEHEFRFYYGNATPCTDLCEGDFEAVAFLVGQPGTETITPTTDPSVTPSETVTETTSPTVSATATSTTVPPTVTQIPPTATRVPPTATRIPPTATRGTGTPSTLPKTGSGGYLDPESSGWNWLLLAATLGVVGAGAVTWATLHYAKNGHGRE